MAKRVLFFCLSAVRAFGTGASGSPKVCTLHYFDARGAAELTRVLLTVGGIAFKDNRFEITMKEGKFETPSFTAAKEAGKLKVNMDRVPVLELEDGSQLGQSKAMERYVAKICGFAGESDFIAAQIDCVAEHVRDIKDKWGKIRAIGGMQPNQEKDAATAKFLQPDGEYETFLRKLENALPANRSPGFAVGSSVSYADFAIWHLIRDTFLDENTLANSKAAALKCPALMEIVGTVEALPALSNYLKTRKVTRF